MSQLSWKEGQIYTDSGSYISKKEVKSKNTFMFVVLTSVILFS